MSKTDKSKRVPNRSGVARNVAGNSPNTGSMGGRRRDVINRDIPDPTGLDWTKARAHRFAQNSARVAEERALVGKPKRGNNAIALPPPPTAQVPDANGSGNYSGSGNFSSSDTMHVGTAGGGTIDTMLRFTGVYLPPGTIASAVVDAAGFNFVNNAPGGTNGQIAYDVKFEASLDAPTMDGRDPTGASYLTGQSFLNVPADGAASYQWDITTATQQLIDQVGWVGDTVAINMWWDNTRNEADFETYRFLTGISTNITFTVVYA